MSILSKPISPSTPSSMRIWLMFSAVTKEVRDFKLYRLDKISFLMYTQCQVV